MLEMWLKRSCAPFIYDVIAGFYDSFEEMDCESISMQMMRSVDMVLRLSNLRTANEPTKLATCVKARCQGKVRCILQHNDERYHNQH